MAGRAQARGALDAISTNSARHCSSALDRDVSLSQEPLLQGPLGEAVRARPSDGQVSCSMATLLAPNGQQPSCFPCETVQALFVFHGSLRENVRCCNPLARAPTHTPARASTDAGNTPRARREERRGVCAGIHAGSSCTASRKDKGASEYDAARNVVSAATVTAWGNRMGTEPRNYNAL
jgi:hypothetical protein